MLRRHIPSTHQQYHSVYGKQTWQNDELQWLAPIYEVTQPFGHVVLQNHLTNQNHYISTKTVPIATKPGFIFSCSHYYSTIFTLTSYSLHAKDHANLYFNQCSIFTEYCFQLRNRFQWSKYLLVKLLPLNKSIPKPKFPTSPYLLTLFGKPCLTT